MHFQTFLASLQVCIFTIHLAVNAAPVTLGDSFTSTDVEHFHLASEVLKNFQHLTSAYQQLTDKSRNTTDLAFQSTFNETMTALTKERTEELKMIVRLMTGNFPHDAATVDEPTAMLHFNESLEALSPGPEELQMMFNLAEQMDNVPEPIKNPRGLRFAFVKTSQVPRDFNGTFFFNRKEFSPFCIRPSSYICDHFKICPSRWHPCPVRPDQHIFITDEQSMPDIVIFNHTIYQPLSTFSDINVKDSTTGVTQRDLEGKNDTTKAPPTTKLPPKCITRGSPNPGLDLPHCLTSNPYYISDFPTCPEGYMSQLTTHLAPSPIVVCTPKQPIEATSSVLVSSEPLLEPRSDLEKGEGNHTIFLPDKCDPLHQPDVVKGIALCSEIPLFKGMNQDGTCPYMYTLEREHDLMICYLNRPKKDTPIREEGTPTSHELSTILERRNNATQLPSQCVINEHYVTKDRPIYLTGLPRTAGDDDICPHGYSIQFYRYKPFAVCYLKHDDIKAPPTPAPASSQEISPRENPSMDQPPCPSGIRMIRHGQPICVTLPENEKLSTSGCRCWFLGCYDCT